MSISTTLRAIRSVRIGFALVFLALLPAVFIRPTRLPVRVTVETVAAALRSTSPVLPGPEGPSAVLAEHKLLTGVVQLVDFRIAEEKTGMRFAAFVARSKVVHHRVVSVTTSSFVAPTDLASVMQCIKDHESGDYTRNNHGPSGASGAYQIIKSTWDHWSVLAGHGGYAAAYLAPPEMQDAVVVYMLTHGGAGNWSTAFGNDPCTG